MINGLVVGLVVDNVDPDRLGRVKVTFPVDAEDAPRSDWVRIAWPDAGKDRGTVMLPESVLAGIHMSLVAAVEAKLNRC